MTSTVATKLLTLIPDESVRRQLVLNCKGNGCLEAAFLFLIMKKFLIFLLFLSLLIISEYFLVSELFYQKRLPVLLVTLAGSLFCLFAAYRFFKKYFLTAKHSKAHN